MRVACVLMQRNEQALLEPWLCYHGNLFGFENLFVIDHGSDHLDVMGVLANYEAAGVTVRRLPAAADYLTKGEIVSAELRALDATGLYDFLFPIDCDEFLVLYGRHGRSSCDRVRIHAYLETLAGETRLLQIKRNLLNVLHRPGYFRDFSYQKVFFAQGCAGWVNHGYHVGGSTRSPDRVESGLAYIHYHHRGYHRQRQASLRKLNGRVDTEDVEALRLFRGEGWHLVENLLLTEEAYNEKFLPSRYHVYCPQFESAFRGLGIDPNFCEEEVQEEAPVAMVSPLPFRPIVQVQKQGNIANQMIQVMVALSIAERAGGMELSSIEIPEWGIVIPKLAAKSDGFFKVSWHAVDFQKIVEGIEAKTITGVHISGYGHRMENFLPRERYVDVFRSNLDVEGFGPGYLVCDIRGGEILSGRLLNDTLVPIEFYQMITEQSGLVPVFMGQIEDNAYVKALRQAFPGARFMPSEGTIRDFEIIRRSRNIAVNVGTFSWLAAWLSNAARIYLPLTGFLNPFQYPDVDLLPLADKRYIFWLVPD